MAWVEETKKDCFRVGWRDGSGRQHYRAARSREAALDLKREIEQGRPASVSPPLAEYVSRMLNSSWDLRGSSLYAYRGILQRHVAGAPVGRRPLGEITTDELRGFLGALSCGPSARAAVYRLLAKAMNQAVREGLLNRSPLRAIPKPKEQPREIRPLESRQVEALANAANPRYRVPVLVAGYLGLRAGEIGGLRLQDIDFEKSTLAVVRATYREGGKRVLGDVKTPAARRRISVPLSLMEEIGRHVEFFPPAEDGRIFTAPSGALLVNIVLWKALADAARRVGIPRPRFHDLRHTCASLMIAEGAHPKMVQARLGHSSIAITMGTYVHLFPSADEELATAMNEVRERALRDIDATRGDG